MKFKHEHCLKLNSKFNIQNSLNLNLNYNLKTNQCSGSAVVNAKKIMQLLSLISIKGDVFTLPVLPYMEYRCSTLI